MSSFGYGSEGDDFSWAKPSKSDVSKTNRLLCSQFVSEVMACAKTSRQLLSGYSHTYVQLTLAVRQQLKANS
jgi:hypothetical protein